MKMLEPMKYYRLNNLDEIKFGSVLSQFHHNEVVESSQSLNIYSTRASLEITQRKIKFFVPETQMIESGIEEELAASQEDIEIPETQNETEMLRTPPQGSENSSAIGPLLDILSETDDDKSNDANPLFSQNLFDAVSTVRPKSSTSNDDDGLDDILIPPPARERDGTVTPDIDLATSREGSVTPDLEMSTIIFPIAIKKENETSSSIRQSEISTFVNLTKSEHIQVKQERFSSSIPSQGDIETQVHVQVKQERFSSSIPLQADIQTQVYENFSDEGDENLNPRLMEPTQPVFIVGSRTRLQLKRQADIKPKTISLTEFDATQDFPPSPKKLKSCFIQETQPVLANFTQKPENGKVVNKILLTSDEDSDEKTSPRRESKRGFKSVITSPRTPPRMSDSPLMSDVTPEILPRIPSLSQIEPFLEMVNASQKANDSSTEAFETISQAKSIGNKQEFIDMKNKNVKNIRRKIMKYDSDDDDNAPSTSKTVPKPKSKKTVKIMKVDKIDLKIPKQVKKIYAFANTSVDPEVLKKFEKISSKLGYTSVEHSQEADILFSGKFKFTAKFLAAICKGIPIVGLEFFEASEKAGKWLDPHEFIISDAKIEKKKEICLKKLLKKTAQKKFLHDFSVFVTSNTVIERIPIKDIIECAGGVFVSDLSQVPRHQNLALIFNEKDQKDRQLITKKYPKIIQVEDLQFCNSILRQKM